MASVQHQYFSNHEGQKQASLNMILLKEPQDLRTLRGWRSLRVTSSGFDIGDA